MINARRTRSYGQTQVQGVFVDTNLLVLFLVGLVSCERIRNFKRTQDFTVEDFYLLQELITWFGRPIFSTPYVLSQVSDLTDLKGQEGRRVRHLLRDLVSTIGEQYDSAKDLVQNPLFERLGLADASIATVCKRNVLIVTADLELQIALGLNGLDALNFNHVRALNWR